MSKNRIAYLPGGNFAVTIDGATLVVNGGAVVSFSAAEETETAKSEETDLPALRKTIRNWMDLLERSAHANKALRITPKECADLGLVFRQIQDAAAKPLGYE